MRSFQDLSINRKLAAVLLLTSGSALALACASFVALDLISFRRGMTEKISVLADIIGGNSQAAISFNDPHAAQETLAALGAEPHITAACIYTRDGRRFAAWSRDGHSTRFPPPLPAGAHEFSESFLDLQRPIVLNGEPIGTVFIRSDLLEMRRRMGSYAAAAGLVLLGALLAALVISARLRRLLSEPILDLAATARTVSEEKDYSLRAMRRGLDEVGRLTDAFNEMLAQIQARDEALRHAHDELERRVEERTHELKMEVAERTRAEEALQRLADQLARSNRELQDFASVASHDLQEPLRKVQMLGDRLRAKCGEGLGEQGLDYLGRMQDAAARMQVLIDDLLLFSRVTTQAQPFVPVNLGKVIGEVLSDLEARLEETRGTVEVGDLTTIDADPTQMRQLLQNLIGNALKFHRPGTPPLVQVRGRLLDGDGDGEAARAPRYQLLVEDNGIGFDEKYLDRIFAVFQRLHGRGRYEGTGVGLAVCRKIVERHEGTITARSRPGEGSTFVVTLPARQPRLKE